MTKGWFERLGLNEEERYRRIWKGETIEGEKDRVVRKLWKEKKKRMKKERI